MATKKCPFCGEELQAEAIKCRFCKEFLQKNAIPVQQTQTPAKQEQPAIPQDKELSAAATNNTALWFLAFLPIWEEIVSRIIIGFYQVHEIEELFSKTAAALRTALINAIPGMNNVAMDLLNDSVKYHVAIIDQGDFDIVARELSALTGNQNLIPSIHWLYSWIIFIIIFSIVCRWDAFLVSRCNKKKISVWWCCLFPILVPVYMFRRAKLLHTGWACFWIWIGLFFGYFIIAPTIIEPTVQEFFKMVYLYK